jgi:hypothetical protein
VPNDRDAARVYFRQILHERQTCAGIIELVRAHQQELQMLARLLALGSFLTAQDVPYKLSLVCGKPFPSAKEI